MCTLEVHTGEGERRLKGDGGREGGRRAGLHSEIAVETWGWGRWAGPVQEPWTLCRSPGCQERWSPMAQEALPSL